MSQMTIIKNRRKKTAENLIQHKNQNLIKHKNEYEQVRSPLTNTSDDNQNIRKKKPTKNLVKPENENYTSQMEQVYWQKPQMKKNNNRKLDRLTKMRKKKSKACSQMSQTAIRKSENQKKDNNQELNKLT